MRLGLAQLALTLCFRDMTYKDTMQIDMVFPIIHLMLSGVE